MQLAKRSQARSAGKVYVPPGHKLSCDPRRSPDMCSPDSIGKYILPKTAGNGRQFAKMMEHRNICQRRGAFWQSGAARYSRARSCSVAIRDGRCDNDDATFDCFPLIYRRMYKRHGRSQCSRGPSSFECCDNDDSFVVTYPLHALGN